MSEKTRSIIDYFGEIQDPRRATANKRHDLVNVLVIALCGMLSAADDWVSIEQYGKANHDWFSKFLSLPNGIPSHDTFSRIFSAIDPNHFMDCFLSWTKSICAEMSQEMLAVDGKTLRRSHDGKNKEAIHMVSAWASENNIVLGQIKTSEKSNEITAIPELLDKLSLQNCIVTIDAMGCQKAIAEVITDQGGDYLLAVKDNQSTLKTAIESTFEGKRPKKYLNPSIDYFETVEQSRNRLETRRCWVTSSLGKLTMADEWKGLQKIAMVESERTINGKMSKEKRYYISSSELGAEQTLYASRVHWGVENKLHWNLDVSFREDESRVRKGHGAENLSRLRHIALNILKQDKTKKVGIKNKRLVAAWDRDYLLHLLTDCYSV